MLQSPDDIADIYMFKISGGSRGGGWGGMRIRRGAQAGNGAISNFEKEFHGRAVGELASTSDFDERHCVALSAASIGNHLLLDFASRELCVLLPARHGPCLWGPTVVGSNFCRFRLS
jgi:hypothetical protein